MINNIIYVYNITYIYNFFTREILFTRFIDVIETCYTVPLLIDLMACVCALSITLTQVCWAKYIDKIFGLLKCYLKMLKWDLLVIKYSQQYGSGY